MCFYSSLVWSPLPHHRRAPGDRLAGQRTFIFYPAHLRTGGSRGGKRARASWRSWAPGLHARRSFARRLYRRALVCVCLQVCACVCVLISLSLSFLPNWWCALLAHPVLSTFEERNVHALFCLTSPSTCRQFCTLYRCDRGVDAAHTGGGSCREVRCDLAQSPPSARHRRLRDVAVMRRG